MPSLPPRILRSGVLASVACSACSRAPRQRSRALPRRPPRRPVPLYPTTYSKKTIDPYIDPYSRMVPTCAHSRMRKQTQARDQTLPHALPPLRRSAHPPTQTHTDTLKKGEENERRERIRSCWVWLDGEGEAGTGCKERGGEGVQWSAAVGLFVESEGKKGSSEARRRSPPQRRRERRRRRVGRGGREREDEKPPDEDARREGEEQREGGRREERERGREGGGRRDGERGLGRQRHHVGWFCLRANMGQSEESERRKQTQTPATGRLPRSTAQSRRRTSAPLHNAQTEREKSLKEHRPPLNPPRPNTAKRAMRKERARERESDKARGAEGRRESKHHTNKRKR
eukprot:2555463-Rhodomonas_salina.1